MQRPKILAQKRQTFQSLEYEGEPKPVFDVIDAYRQLIDRKNRGERFEEPNGVPLGLVGGGGWATVNGLALEAALNESGHLRGLYAIMCTSNGVNITAYTLANQVPQARAFFTRKATVHRTLDCFRNLWRFRRLANLDHMSRLVSGRLIKGEQAKRHEKPLAEELSDPGSARRYEAARANGRKVFNFLELDQARLKSAGPRLYATLTDAETGQGSTASIIDAKNPVIALSAAITLPIGYPDRVTINGRPVFDGGFAFSNLPLSPGLAALAKEGRKPSAVLAILSFPSNKENGGFEKYPAYLANRIFQTRKALGPISNLNRNFETELEKLRELRRSGVPVLILRPRKGNVRLSDKNIRKMDKAFQRVKSSADAFIARFASKPRAQS
jgi:predicted patatin/cPLA2 family phospholipase